MFTAKWKKDAKLLAKGARKFVNYKRDLLKPDRVEEIESRRADLLKAVKEGDREKSNEASKQLKAICENSLPREKPQGWFEENVEVMFVAIVIALGLRAYYLQPFRIPTGSMQPTLNGIVGTKESKEKWPSFPTRMLQMATKGRNYVKVVSDRDCLISFPGGHFPVMDYQKLHFFTRSRIICRDGSSIELPGPASQMLEIGLRDAFNKAYTNGGMIPAGTVLCEGYLDSGDLVLVDKMSYQFRRPHRGEVFVFDTLGIRGIEEYDREKASAEPGGAHEQAGGTHYIKRLGGVPGDSLSIQTPNLLVNGKVAQEPGFQRVAKGGPPFSKDHHGYVLASPEVGKYQYLTKPTDQLVLSADAPPGLREYAAFGDNTGNSLDSRYWGTVKEFNLVGPALFSLWPFSTGHWGFIH
ncbi:signal peptidase I [Luteolibacter pohnpeiensis]|uniref:Signal peptidase I n=1 Tax=Luteolibacter pohnpeiensis TaxID=454153 RepID=A0A934SCQ5_9BACT|nr:signal peptidase I [Luteolibacter pohnpeiensis]MBK1883494.1 signal peptidase I [Luteolibacter pohnpeiensis]